MAEPSSTAASSASPPAAAGAISNAFATAKTEGRAALMPYLMGGFPDQETSTAVANAYADAGADLIELGVPFSDPIADGPIIQESSYAALLQGMNYDGALTLIERAAAALGLALMWVFVIEGIIPALTHEPGIIRWLPEAAANAVLHGASPAATALSAGAALAVLAGYAAVLAGAGAALTVRREIGTTTG